MRLFRFVMLLAAAAALAACGSQNDPNHSDPPASAASMNNPVASQSGQEQVPTGRLPTDVQPQSYTLHFSMDPDKAGYNAHEALVVKLTKPRDTIWFHGRGIDVKSAKLKLANGKTLDIDYKQVNKAGVAKLSLGRTVKPQKATIVIDFHDPYDPGLMGAYKVKENGDNYIFTQFEAIAARRAFPSFDEPAFKTPFTYSFTVPKGDKVVANTPVKNKTSVGNNEVKWQFMTTKPLPTYLVAWAIGPFDIVKGAPMPPDSVRDHPVPVYGVTVKGKGKLIQYAVKHAGDIIEAEEKYYGIAYPWKKVALIAVPDFAAGAMENPGAVTFRSQLLLFNPKTAPTRQKRAYWSVAAHELGHMWTGDLVTVPWWNDIWLNEAFATWQAQKVLEKLHPEWNPKMDALQSQQRAMHADSLASARAIRQPIKDTGDIKTAFDGITYAKGSAVISMFEDYVGKAKFRKGMHRYLTENAYGSANLEDFLHAISKAAGEHIGPAFKTFLNQSGLPMVKATLKMNNGKPSVHLVQSRYLPVGSSGSRQGRQWRIPVCMRYPVNGKTTEQCTLLKTHSADVALNGDSLPKWFMPNAMGNGYYQWALADSGYQQLTRSLDQLKPTGQMSLASSIEAAYGAAKIHTATLMKSLAPLARSKHNPVAEEPMGDISFAREHLVDKDTRGAVEAYARKLYSPYNVAGDFKQGGAPDNANQRQFEAKVAGFLAHTGQDKAIHKAADHAAERLLGMGDNDKPNLRAVAPDFIPVVLRVAVHDEGKPVFDKLDAIFNKAKRPLVRSAALRAMASAKQPKLAKKVRAMALDPDVTKRNEVRTILYGQIFQPETRDATWKWIKSNYGKLSKRMPGSFGGRIPAVAGAFCSDKKANEVKAFFKGKLEAHPGSKRTLAQAMERAHLCAAMKKAQQASAEEFFSQM